MLGGIRTDLALESEQLYRERYPDAGERYTVCGCWTGRRRRPWTSRWAAT